MKATIESTDRIAPISKDGKITARVWEGVTEDGKQFVAYIPILVFPRGDPGPTEHKRPSMDAIIHLDRTLLL